MKKQKVESRKEENEKVRKENEHLRKNNVDAKIKKSIEKLTEIKSLEEDKNTTDWFDRNKFKEILAIIDSNKFNYRNKIGEFKFIDIRNLVNNIRNKTISEIDAKKHLNTLNKIKNAEIIKHKRHTTKYKELNLLDNFLNIILTDKTLESKSQEDKNKNENEKVEKKKIKMKMKMKMKMNMIMKMKMKLIMKMKMKMKMMIIEQWIKTKKKRNNKRKKMIFQTK